MDLYNLKNKKLTQVESKPFNLEKDIQTIIEENTQELFNLQFVTTEFSIGDFRLDSLCFDEENKSFVIIEYKKHKSYSVIDQGYSYLSLMLNNKSDFNQNTDLLLYMAARSENINLIKNSYKKKIILIDRFTDSTIAYQHYGMGVDINLIKTLNKYLLKNIEVDFTFLNIVNKKNLHERLKKRKSLNRYDRFNMTFYNKVQNGFMKLSKLKKNKYELINSNLDIKNNEKLILNIIDKLI